MPADEALARAVQAAKRAVALDETLGEAYAALGSVLFWRDGRWDQAARAFKTALKLDPENARAHRDNALLLSAQGRLGEAGEEIGTAWRLDSSSPRTSLDAGWIYYFRGRHEEAIEECRFSRPLMPGSRDVRSCLLAAALQAEHDGQSLEVLREVATAAGVDLPAVAGGQGLEVLQETADWLTGATDDVDKLLSAIDVARIHMMLGQNGPALEALGRALDDAEPGLAWLAVDPAFRTLHDDARFQLLLEQLGPSS